MDSQSLGRGKASTENALRKIKAKTLVIGIDTDILFPTSEQKFIAENILDTEYMEITSNYGHDGFLVETKAIAEQINFFLSNRSFKDVELLLYG